MSAPVPAGLAVGSLEGGYGGSPVLQGVNFHIEPGEIFGILGKNGMGKDDPAQNHHGAAARSLWPSRNAG